MISVVSIFLGLTVGSFLNVLIYRLNTGKSLGGRSICFSCGKQLSWFELIPVVSFVLLRGRCRKCLSKISFQYIAVEIITTLFFFALSRQFNFELSTIIETIFLVFIGSIFIVIAVYDIRHKIIPDQLSYALIALTFIRLLLLRESLDPTMYDFLAGPILFIPFYILWKMSDGRWIGLGDGKLAISIGWLLGISGGAASIIFSFWIGAVFALLLLGVGKLAKLYTDFNKKSLISSLTMKSELPFGPFLIVSALVAYFTDLQISDLLYITSFILPL